MIYFLYGIVDSERVNYLIIDTGAWSRGAAGPDRWLEHEQDQCVLPHYQRVHRLQVKKNGNKGHGRTTIF